MNDFARRGLGRGLSALLGEPVRAEPEAGASPMTAFQLPPNVAPFPAPAAAPPPAATAPIMPAPIPTYTPPADAVMTNIAPVSEAPVIPPIAPPVVEAPAAPAAPVEQGSANSAARHIPIDKIQRNPDQPRRTFDTAELEELANSIRAHGVLQPILVRPLRNSDMFEIVAGERRWRAAQIAKLHQLPAVVMELDDRDVLEIAIIENVQRADLNPLEEAQGYQALLERFNRTQADVAEQVGKSRPHIANMLRLLSLPNDIQEMVRDGRLSAGHARAILTAPDPHGLAKLAIANGLSVREVEKLAQRAKDERDGPRAARPDKDADTLALENQIANALGLGVVITHKGEVGGEIRITYKKLEQLDEICRKLSA
jgi:ParB family transcriptional regulator, chromosome partitioning protein